MFFTNEYYNKIKIPASKTQVNLNMKSTSRVLGTKSKKRAAPFGNIISVVDGRRIGENIFNATVEKKPPPKILILANSILENLCYFLKKELEKNKFECTIQHTKLKNKINDTIFLISPTLISYIPEKFFYFQVEQLNGISTDSSHYKAITTLAKKSIQTFDYSKTNIKYYPKNIHIEYFPFNFSTKTWPLEKKYDVLFFGCVNSGINGKTSNRRKKILLKLANKFKINVPKKFIYGKELTKIINQSKIMLNLHFYDNAILETARLQEGVGLNTHIISEYPCEEDMEAIEPYKNRVEFVEIIKDDLSNIHLLEEKIEELLKGEKEVPVWENKIVNNTNLLFYPHLFHKYILGLSKVNDPIKYEIVQQKDVSGNYFAHLHCYDISKFDEIYGEYIKTIKTYFNIVITYSLGKNNIERYTVLKIPNKGLDIGAKFCMVQYLKDQKEDYSYIFFLHSKSNAKIRKKYFKPLISAIKDNKIIENINDFDGYFPNIQWKIKGGKLKMISGNPKFAYSNLPERNMLYRNELLKYLGCENQTNNFVEGNVYILSKKIVEKIFGEKKLYNILNRTHDFDYNWMCQRYKLCGNILEVYNECKAKRLVRRDKLSYDGFIEHAFERVVLNLCSNDRCAFFPNFLKKYIKNDIVILAVYPRNFNYLFTINLLLKLNFKKIIIIYSAEDSYKIGKACLLENPKIQIIKVDNIGYDFKKYYTGLMATKNKKYNRIWLINDSFIITNPRIFVGDMWKQILHNDLVGCYYSREIKDHIQSYFMILSNKMVKHFMRKLTPYKFTSINSAQDKKKLILDLEVNLTNEILNNKNYACSTLHKTPNTLKGNPILELGPTNEWVKTNENSVILEKFKLSWTQKFILYVTGCTEFIETYEGFHMKKNRNPHIKGIALDFFKKKWNMLLICRNLIPDYKSNHSIAVNVLYFLKNYKGNDDIFKILQKMLFEFNKPVEKITTEDDLKKIVKKNQKQTKNRKLVYTCNIGGYDSFHDIADKYIEDGVDYIYISNRKDEGCCKNFIHVFCNLNEPDNFKFNRKIKFDKTLFDCYEKVCYVDANVRIHCKLGRFWDKLEDDIELVLFSHPERNSALEEIYTIKNSIGSHNKWNLNNNKVNEMCENFKGSLNNDLFWLSVQLSTTKRNIYEGIQEMYEKYKLKRDQIYFSLIKNCFNILKIEIKIKRSREANNQFLRDGDYGVLLGWSDKFSRPFGGSHI